MTTAKATKKSKATSAKPITTISDVEFNPLAEKLSERHAESLDELHDLIGDLFEITDPVGYAGNWESGYRPATNREASMAELEGIGSKLQINLRGDIAAQAAEKLRQFARDVLTRARRIEIAAKRGAFKRVSKGYFVVKDGKDLYGPVSQGCAAAFANSHGDGSKVVRRLKPGPDRVMRYAKAGE